MTRHTPKFTVYGLRLKGEREARYIGQTVGSGNLRLKGHKNEAPKGRHNKALCEWLSENGDDVEAFHIAYTDTRDEALAMERAIIALCLRLEQRLFNQRNIPSELREAA
jgi:hypothetical protein